MSLMNPSELEINIPLKIELIREQLASLPKSYPTQKIQEYLNDILEGLEVYDSEN